MSSNPAVAQIKMIALLGGVSFERAASLEDVREHLEDPQTVFWVDVLAPGPEDLSALIDLFGFHPLAMEDVANGSQRPKVDEYKGHLYGVSYGVARGTQPNDFHVIELHMFMGRNYLVTLHSEPLLALDEAQNRWTRGSGMLAEGVGFLVYAVLDAVVDGYFPVVDAMELLIEASEEAMVRGPTDQQVGELLDIRRDVLRLRRVVNPMREAFNTLVRRDRSIFSAGTQVYFQDVNDHLLRLLDLIEAQRDLVNSALDASLTIVSNRLNATMKRLTTVSAVVGFAAAVFSAWGMNFAVLPAAESGYGFPIVVGGTVFAVLGGMAFGKKRGWL